MVLTAAVDNKGPYKRDTKTFICVIKATQNAPYIALKMKNFSRLENIALAAF